MARVFVDTNVLFPFSVMDLMLALTEDAVHEVLWTEALLAEWERVIVRERRRSAESAASITASIREFFPEGEVAEEEYAHLVATMPGQDEDDRHHMAAAVAGSADTIVTWNRSDFPADALARMGIRVMDPDEYLCELIVEFPHQVVDTVVRLAAEKRRPPLTPSDIADRVAKAGAPNFAIRVKDHLDISRTADGSLQLAPRHDRGTVSPYVPASEVGAYLAAHRPPSCYNAKLIVPPHNPVGEAAHTIVLRAALLEMLTVWPDGTTLVVDYGDGAYVQALSYPPSVLTEIGQLDQSQLPAAVRFGWMDPAGFSARHADFESQPVWDKNPIREWTHPYDQLQEIAPFLAGSVRALLGCDPGDGYTLNIFNIHVGR